MPRIYFPGGSMSVSREFKVGDPPPDGYSEWFEWAEVHQKAGLKQKPCSTCGKWKYPHEIHSKPIAQMMNSRGKKVDVETVLCVTCASTAKESA